MENHKQILIHAIKAIKYRFIKATNGSKDNFDSFKLSMHTRTPNEIINHMLDLAVKTKCMIREGHFNSPTPELCSFLKERERFLSALEELQEVMDTTAIDLNKGKKLLQGPLLDIATHIGQLAMLNGLNGNKIPKENFYNALIE